MTNFSDCPLCKLVILPSASDYMKRSGAVCVCGAMTRGSVQKTGNAPQREKRVPVQTPLPEAQGSDLEALYLSLLAEYAPDIPKPLQQQYILPERGFKADFYWPDARLIIEIDGLVHRVKSRFASDAEKHNLYVLAGFTYLRFTGAMLRHDITRVIEWTKLGLERGKR